jgi:hypothetical protein
MRGRLPKAEPQDGGARRQFQWIELDGRPAVFAPPLPRIAGRRWLTVTRRWYRDWCESPQAVLFISTDWNALHRLALLVDEFWRGDVRTAGEIRQLEAKLGATMDDRMRLRLRVHLRGAAAEPEAPPEAPPHPRPARADARLKLVEERGRKQ